MNYEEFLVPISIAKKLKEIGFNEPCLFHHIQGGVVVLPKNPDEYTHMYGLEDLCVYRNSFEVSENTFSIPTYEQVFKWFGEKGYTCHFAPVKQPPMYIGSRYAWSYEVLNNGKVITCDTYKDARLGCIRKLIKIYKNENI